MKKHLENEKNDDLELAGFGFDASKINLARKILDKVKAGTALTKLEKEMLSELKQAGVNVPSSPKYPEFTTSGPKMVNFIIEAFNISERKAFSWLQKLDFMKKSRGWPVSEVLEKIAERREEATGGQNQDLKREKLQEEVFILRDKRRERQGELVELKAAEAEFSRRLDKYRTAVTSWKDLQTAKYPKNAKMIEELASELFEMFMESE